MVSENLQKVDLSQDWDVLVIGGGNAALCAAMTAQENGARVLLLEGAPKTSRGGNSRHTRNLRYMHRKANSHLTGPYHEDEFWDDLLRVTKGETNEDLARLTIRQSEDIGLWMADHGCIFQPSMRGTLSLSHTNGFFLGGGKALVNSYYLTAEKLGVKILYEAMVNNLNIRDGRFESAELTIGEKHHSVSAKSIVVASGGFQANLDWLKRYWGDAAENFIVRGTPFNRGRMLEVLLENKAKPAGDERQCHAVAIDARAPKFDGGIVTRLDCVPFGVVVNRDAVRFYDEGEDFWPKRYAIWGRLVAQQPNQIAYSIIDSKSINLFMPSVFPPIQADSLQELASKLELEPKTLQSTIQIFNDAVQTGDFDSSILDNCTTKGLNIPKSHWARAIDTPPFYGYPLRPGITFTYLGVAINQNAQVLMQDEKPFKNIFAAGEVMAGNILGQGYLAGFGMTIGTVFGRIAGKEAALCR
ncbi:MAG: FAD-dependent tricarballylate dehydrogenase TcuA [SAR324 cluster bacterium]|nr:FAD-dependent tricarballylate dehydrogenase TcuA [SAR324 cluster bacterium]